MRDRGYVGWVPRSEVRLPFHEQMVLDLELEGLSRPSSGTEQKEMQGFCFKTERYSFWTKVRGCAGYLASEETVGAIAALHAERDSEVERAERFPTDTVPPQYRIQHINQATRQCEKKIEALLPAPMTTPHYHSWRTLRFYGNVVRGESDAIAFIDEHATRAECTLALQSGMHALLTRYPTLCFTSAALTTVWIEYLGPRIHRKTAQGDDSRAPRPPAGEEVSRGCAAQPPRHRQVSLCQFPSGGRGGRNRCALPNGP